MSPFPAVDPIPLPAPIWLFKFLHNLTLTAHLAAMELVLGGLAMGIILAVSGRLGNSRQLIQVSGMAAHRLPSAMSLLINLGVPPLLFAQVLYGRALYTSSVLMGTYWFSVILLLMASYYGLYYSAKAANDRRPWTAAGLASLLLMLTIAFIYSNNMTLMLRPETWAGMYRQSPMGVQWNTSDPTLWPRWVFFIAGSMPAAGAGFLLLGLRGHFESETRRLLVRAGGIAAAFGIIDQAAAARWALASQPAGVVEEALRNPFTSISLYVWIGTAVVIVAAGAMAAFVAKPNALVSTAVALGVFLNIAGTVMVRDGIRDVTLRMKGFDVWDRQVVTNWSVVILFLLLLVVAIAALIYLTMVMAQAKRIKENYA